MHQFIGITNKSTLVTDKEVRAMVRAVHHQVVNDYAPAWGTRALDVEWLADETEAPAGSWLLGILDNADQQGVLGWHTEDAGDVVYGQVFAKPSLDAGSTALTGPYAVSATVSHEVLETIADPHTNLWADTFQGYSIAYEVCDPVEADGYTYTDRSAGTVQLSNFVLPEWFDPQGVAPYDYLQRCTAPLTMTPGGYWVQAPTGAEAQKFGELVNWESHVGFVLHDGARASMVFSSEYPAWKRDLKIATGARGRARTQ